MATIPGTNGNDFLEGTIDADLIQGGFGNDQLFGYEGNDTLQGGFGNDDFDGGDGDDLIETGDNVGGSDGYDFIVASEGNDTIDLSGIAVGWVGTNYQVAPGPNGFDFTLNGRNNTASVVKDTFGTDTFIDIVNPLASGFFDGGFDFRGTDYDDVFDIKLATEQWMNIRPNAGDDIINIAVLGAFDPFNVEGDERGQMRIDYRNGNQGVVADLSTGTVSNDGFGDEDTIIGRAYEFRLTVHNDNIVGASWSEAFILNAGNDTLDGGGGFDRVRYDRSNEESGIVADLNLTTGTVTGFANGAAFTHNLTNVEWVRGSEFGDQITGDDEGNRLEGKGGNDTIDGGGGKDVLEGGDFDDVLIGGAGVDRLYGGQGKDTLTGGTGSDQLFGGGSNDILDGGGSKDVLLGGSGNDTLTGGGGADDFIFEEGFGNDVITDFNAFSGAEDIVLSLVTEITDFNDLVANHMTQQGADVLIDDGAGSTILIQNVLLADLGKGDFIF